MKIGANVSIAGTGLLNAVEESLEYGATTFMIYTRSNRGGNARDITKFSKDEAFALMKENGLDIKDAVVHAPYYINLAGEGKARNIGKAVLTDEIKRTEFLEIPYLVFHPGSHVKQGVEVGIQNIINSLNEILTGDEKVFVLLETMAGDGSKVGNSFEEIAQIINGVDEDKRHVLGVCMDTCHNFSYGYDIVNDFDKVIEDFDQIIGLDRLKVLHLNDSKYPLGAKKDRHANIGSSDGNIPKEALRAICQHKAIKDLPIILETPFGQYKEEIEYMRGNDDANLSEQSLK
ncbi:deoxyribonuclease IV [Bacillus horti]|uniref:Probable endonuclease 4 n=1 Tax=Caldalkalibacillus horti TaxID=77523 RepID=A0ABT9VY48_9BACI|nr:deoxyribonuclease IV [Bacillus horti]MDQ0165800.1 deoxyribonuclease-4 [Bacillus horti]